MEYFSCISALAIEQKRRMRFVQISNCKNLHTLLNGAYMLLPASAKHPLRNPCSQSRCTGHMNWTWIHIATSHFWEHKHNPMQIFGFLLLLTVARIIVLVTIVIFGVLHIIRKSNFVYKHLLPRFQLFSSFARNYIASTMHEFRSNINSFRLWLELT